MGNFNKRKIAISWRIYQYSIDHIKLSIKVLLSEEVLSFFGVIIGNIGERHSNICFTIIILFNIFSK